MAGSPRHRIVPVRSVPAVQNTEPLDRDGIRLIGLDGGTSGLDPGEMDQVGELRRIEVIAVGFVGIYIVGSTVLGIALWLMDVIH